MKETSTEPPTAQSSKGAPHTLNHTTSSSPKQVQEVHEPVEHLRWSFFAEIVNVLRFLIIFAGELHCECLTGF